MNARGRLGEDGSLYSQAPVSGTFKLGPPDDCDCAPPLGVAMLPLLSWLRIAAPFLIVVVMLLPFLVRRPRDEAGITP